MTDIDELSKLALPHKIKSLIVSYEKEIEFCTDILNDLEVDDDKSKVIYETMLREKSMFLQVLKNL
jgi:hypothetical protein